MNEINKTLYIPLFGKAQVSKKGIIISDRKAEEIWEKEQFQLKGKANSKWLTYFLAMRAKVFDEWVIQQIQHNPEAIILHIGCGMDSRNLRVSSFSNCWYDVDFPDVITERKKYYSENEKYHMLGADASKTAWIENLPEFSQAVVILEGISMYLKNEDVTNLFAALQRKFKQVNILMDAYTTLGAKVSKYKNPINDVGVTHVYGMDEPESVIKDTDMQLIKEHSMTPPELVKELSGFDRIFFKTMFTGKVARKLYRLFEYQTL